MDDVTSVNLDAKFLSCVFSFTFIFSSKGRSGRLFEISNILQLFALAY